MSLSGLPAFSPAPADDDAAERRLRVTLERVIADRDATHAVLRGLSDLGGRVCVRCGLAGAAHVGYGLACLFAPSRYTPSRSGAAACPACAVVRGAALPSRRDAVMVCPAHLPATLTPAPAEAPAPRGIRLREGDDKP